VCPEILDDLTMILGGGVTALDVEESVKGTELFRELVVKQIDARGIGLT